MEVKPNSLALWLVAASFSLLAAFLVVWTLQPKKPDPRVTHITVDPASRRAAAALADGRIYTWFVEGDSTPTSHIRVAGAINELEFSLDGQTIAVASDNLSLATYDRPTVPILLRDNALNYGVARFDPTGTRIATISGKGEILVIDLAAKSSRTLCCTTIYSDLRWLPANRIVTAGHHPAIWNAVTGQLIARLTPERESMAMGPILIHPTANLILVGSQDGGIRAFDASTHSLRASSPRTPDWVETMALRPATDWIAYAQRGRTVRWWNVATNEHREWPNTSTTSTLAFTREGLLLTGTPDGRVEEWNPETQARTRTWKLP